MKDPCTSCIQGNLSEDWRKWFHKFGFYLLSKPDIKIEQAKVGTFLSLNGDEALGVFGTLMFHDDAGDFTNSIQNASCLTVSTMAEKFVDHCQPRKDQLQERYKLWQRIQQEGESTDQYATGLRSTYKTPPGHLGQSERATQPPPPPPRSFDHGREAAGLLDCWRTSHNRGC